MRNLFKKAVEENRNFFNDCLEPLFYNALANGERDNNWCVELNCKIPFLNGGLFETIGGYSWTDTDIILDNSIFSNTNKTKNGDIGDGILDVFDRYNFTVKEDEPLEKEVAVDPEILGKVFEELLEVEDRKSKGAFYTPREIVHYMCQESLINYLATELSALEEDITLNQNEQLNLIEPETKQLDFTNVLTKKDISDFIHFCDSYSQSELIATQREGQNSKYKHKFSNAIEINAKAIDEALENIKICDPAIGSGAFPVGMLNEIVRARIALVEFGFLKEAKKRSIYEYKRQAIQNSIYGVDIEVGAVEIAKLRLWLSLVVDEEDIENIKALPNLDYKIVCGNSLLNVERNLFNDGLFKRLEELKPLFFNETRKSEKRRLKKDIDAIIKDLTKDGTFDFEIYFSEVFHEKGGFDVIIGNPPYIKEYVDKSAFDNLKESKYYQGKMDLWYFFGCVGIDKLCHKGHLVYIAPNNWTTNTGASIFRNKILDETDILHFIDFGDYKVFETADIQTMIFLLKKNYSQSCNVNYRKLIFYKNNNNVLDNFLTKNNSTSSLNYKLLLKKSEYKDKYITFLNPQNLNLLTKIKNKSNFQLLDFEIINGVVPNPDFVNKKTIEKIPISKRVALNIKTGDGVFVIKKEFENIPNEETSYLKPLFEPANCKKYFLPINAPQKLIYLTKKNCSLNPQESVLIKHLEKYKEIMEDRRENLLGRIEFFHIHWARNEEFFLAHPKILSIRKCAKPTFIYTENEAYVMNAMNVIYSKRINLKYLISLYNSKLIEFWLKYKGKMQGDNFQVDSDPILNIPIYKIDETEQHKYISVVDKILSITQTEDYLQNDEKQNAVKEYEKQIDIMVYKLYELTYDEVLTIDKDFSLTKEEYEKFEL